jgi:endothelin-converting enzyme/putative endopeptidase
MRRLLFVFLCLSTFALAQQKNPDELPKLQHLSADQVNPQFDPCTDFYQYACSKFFAANPIPPDQAGWGVAGPLLKWNETVMRQALEAAAAKKQGRTAAEQKIGDYWSSCMDESKVETASAKAFQLDLKRIDDLKWRSSTRAASRCPAAISISMTMPSPWKYASNTWRTLPTCSSSPANPRHRPLRTPRLFSRWKPSWPKAPWTW